MALDTVNLSDIGTSLVAIEAEIKSNCDSMDYYESLVRALRRKNNLLQDTAASLIKNSLPHLVMRSGDFKP